MKVLRSSAFTKIVTIGSKTVDHEVESCHKVVDQTGVPKSKAETVRWATKIRPHGTVKKGTF